MTRTKIALILTLEFIMAIPALALLCVVVWFLMFLGSGDATQIILELANAVDQANN